MFSQTETIDYIKMGENQPPISVIIPTLNGDVTDLVDRLENQSILPDDVCIVRGVRPNGRARNLGVARVRQERKDSASHILIFLDDDALPGNDDLVKNLITPWINGSEDDQEQIGITGTARVLPEDANWFQRRVATEIPRTVNPIPQQALETNPPLEGYGHSLITTTCCATLYSIYEQAGKFSERLTSGVDTDFFYRVRKNGYRFLMVPNAFVLHPAPDNLRSLLRKFFWYGIGYGQEAQRRPQQKIGPQLPSLFHRIIFLLAASLWVIPNIFLIYSFSYPRFEFGFRPLKAISTYAVAFGYTSAWWKGLET